MATSFRIWQDELMTIPLASLVFTTVLGENQKRQGVFYFGSPFETVKLETEQNAGVDNILLSPVAMLSEISRDAQYSIENCNDFLLNGFVYRLIQAGITAGAPPAYSQTIGTITTDGTAQFQCVSKAHTITEIKLALSENALQTAVAGGSLQLGATINGGASIAVYYELENSVDNVFNDFNCPQLCISINECMESAK